MAWPPPLLGLLLLLTVLSSFWTPIGAGDRKVNIQVPPVVYGYSGHTVNLTCNLQALESEIPSVKQIRWERLESWGEPKTLVEILWSWGPRILDPDRVQFVAAWKGPGLLNSSLTLSELRPDDDANYTCEVITFQHGSWRASTWLRVFYAPQVSISLVGYTGQQGHREISLSCDARGNPEPRSYEWSTTTGHLPPSTIPKGTRLLLQPLEKSINTTFICRVSNTLGMSQAAMRVLLPGLSRKQSSLCLVLMIIFTFVVLGVVVTLVYFRYFRKSRQIRHIDSENEVSLLCSHVRITSESCRIEMKTEVESELETKAETEAGMRRRSRRVKAGTNAETETEIETEDDAKTEGETESENKVEKKLIVVKRKKPLLSRITEAETKAEKESEIEAENEF